MKRVIIILFALILCLSLCGCEKGSTSVEEHTTTPATEQTETIPETLPVETEPTYITVEITMDNWQTYFEVRTFETYEYDAFGELVVHNVGTALFLKDQYLQILEKAEVTFKVNSTVSIKEINKETYDFIQDGRIYSTEQYELNTETKDCRTHTDTNTLKSTVNGTVYAPITEGMLVVTEDPDNRAEVMLCQEHCDEYEVINVIGMLTIME